MDVTDRTIEQVLVELLQSENLWLIMLCCFLVGLAIGSLLMMLYFTKIRYYSLKNELENTKTTLTQAEHERDEYKQKFEDAQNRIECFQDMEYARLATEPDIAPSTIKSKLKRKPILHNIGFLFLSRDSNLPVGASSTKFSEKLMQSNDSILITNENTKLILNYTVYPVFAAT